MVLGCTSSIDISAEEYEAAQHAKAGVLASLDIEEKLNLVLEDYAEFELELQELATRYYLFHGRTWSSTMGELQRVNRRLANLLSACRLYIDQVKHKVGSLFDKDSTQFKELKAAFSKEYDTTFGYRVMEALRNVVQHCALPVHQLNYDSSRDERKNVVLVKHACSPGINVIRLREEGSFKTQVLRELEDSPLRSEDVVDLTPLVREYVRSIWTVHEGLRCRMREDVNRWDSCIGEIISKFKAACGDKTTGLALVKDDGVSRIESVYITDEFSKRRTELEQKNMPLGNLRLMYVSSEIKADA